MQLSLESNRAQRQRHGQANSITEEKKGDMKEAKETDR